MSWPWVAAYFAIWAAVIVLTLVVLGILRRISAVLEEAEHVIRSNRELDAGVPPGAPVGSFVARNANGDIVTDADLRGRPSVVAFLEAGCEPCKVVASELSRLDRPPTSVPVIIVTDDTVESRSMTVGAYVTVLYDQDGSVSRAFRNAVYPFGFALDEAGVVVEKAIATSVEAIHRLAISAAGPKRPTAIARSGLPVRTNAGRSPHLERR